jgi:hypothetical protein
VDAVRRDEQVHERRELGAEVVRQGVADDLVGVELRRQGAELEDERLGVFMNTDREYERRGLADVGPASTTSKPASTRLTPRPLPAPRRRAVDGGRCRRRRNRAAPVDSARRHGRAAPLHLR